MYQNQRGKLQQVQRSGYRGKQNTSADFHSISPYLKEDKVWSHFSISEEEKNKFKKHFSISERELSVIVAFLQSLDQWRISISERKSFSSISPHLQENF